VPRPHEFSSRTRIIRRRTRNDLLAGASVTSAGGVVFGVRWLDAAIRFCVSFGLSNGGGCRNGAEKAEPKRRQGTALQRVVSTDGPRKSQTEQFGSFGIPSERVRKKRLPMAGRVVYNAGSRNGTQRNVGRTT